MGTLSACISYAYSIDRTCWALLKRCTSSRSRIVRLQKGDVGSLLAFCRLNDTNRPVRARIPFASSATARTSAMPASVALSSLKVALVCLASKRASVVLPHLRRSCGHSFTLNAGNLTYPGGPQNIMLPVAPLRIKPMRSDSGAVRCGCPTKSCRFCGRSRSARGAALDRLEQAAADILLRFEECPTSSLTESASTAILFCTELSAAGAGRKDAKDAAFFLLVDVDPPKIGAIVDFGFCMFRGTRGPFGLGGSISVQLLSKCALISRSRTSREQTGLSFEVSPDTTYQPEEACVSYHVTRCGEHGSHV